MLYPRYERWKKDIFPLASQQKRYIGGKPWSSAYGRRPMCKRSSVWIPAPYTGWTFFTFICCKNCNDVCLKRQKIIDKRPGLVHFLKKDIENRHQCWQSMRDLGQKDTRYNRTITGKRKCTKMTWKHTKFSQAERQRENMFIPSNAAARCFTN